MDLNQRPMFEERRWGWYRVLDYKESDDGTKTLTKRLCISAGKNISYQYHHYRSEVWVIVKVEGEFVLNDEVHFVKKGDVLTIPAGAKHKLLYPHYDLQASSKLQCLMELFRKCFVNRITT